MMYKIINPNLLKRHSDDGTYERQSPCYDMKVCYLPTQLIVNTACL